MGGRHIAARERQRPHCAWCPPTPHPHQSTHPIHAANTYLYYNGVPSVTGTRVRGGCVCVCGVVGGARTCTPCLTRAHAHIHTLTPSQAPPSRAHAQRWLARSSLRSLTCSCSCWCELGWGVGRGEGEGEAPLLCPVARCCCRHRRPHPSTRLHPRRSGGTMRRHRGRSAPVSAAAAGSERVGCGCVCVPPTCLTPSPRRRAHRELRHHRPPRRRHDHHHHRRPHWACHRARLRGVSQA